MQFDVDGVSPVKPPTGVTLLEASNEQFLCGRRQVTRPACIISLNPRDKPVRWLPLVFPFQRMRKLRSERDSPFAPGGRVGGRASPCC